jgi:hypothetical protein
MGTKRLLVSDQGALGWDMMGWERDGGKRKGYNNKRVMRKRYCSETRVMEFDSC